MRRQEKKMYVTSVADPGCLSRIPVQIVSISDPGSEFFPSRIPDPTCKYETGFSSRIRIPDPDPDFLHIPDPGVKKAPDPGSRIRIRNTAYDPLGAPAEADHGKMLTIPKATRSRVRRPLRPRPPRSREHKTLMPRSWPAAKLRNLPDIRIAARRLVVVRGWWVVATAHVKTAGP
jgi:hypothetical protein